MITNNNKKKELENTFLDIFNKNEGKDIIILYKEDYGDCIKNMMNKFTNIINTMFNNDNKFNIDIIDDKVMMNDIVTKLFKDKGYRHDWNINGEGYNLRLIKEEAL